MSTPTDMEVYNIYPSPDVDILARLERIEAKIEAAEQLIQKLHDAVTPYLPEVQGMIDAIAESPMFGMLVGKKGRRR